MAHEVFICYASRDKAVADAVCATLESRHIKCWIAPRDVLPGTEWAETIVDALDESRVLVLVLSSSSNSSPQVIREVGRAASKGIPIIPLRIDEVVPSKAMDFFVSSHHWLDAQTGPLKKHLKRLTDTVQQILARKRAPREAIEVAEAEEKARREAEEAGKAKEEEERAEREAELAVKEREKREAEEARKAQEATARAKEEEEAARAKREAEEARKAEKARERASKEAKEARERARKEAEKAARERKKREAEEAKERRAEPARVPLLKRWRLWSGAAAVLVALVLVFTLLPGGTNGEPPPGGEVPPEEEAPPVGPYGTITNAVADFGNESTDPIDLESLWGWMFYDSLLRWDENGNLISGVADSWSLDGNVWTFKIHEGITFHNGDPLTARDVKFSVDRFSDMEQSSNPWSFYLSPAYNQVETRIVDDYTFQFVADHPEPAQLIVFAWVRILPKDYYEEVGMDEFRAHPIGSGPWMFSELISETKMTLEANADYWREDEIPHYQYYVELEVPEQAARIAMLKTGEVDIAYDIDYDRIPDLLEDGFAIQEFLPSGTCSICIQGSWLPDAGPVGDIRVRKAMSFALNRQEICDTWFSGYAQPGGQFYMYPGCFGWSDVLAAGDPYAPEWAMELLEQAGYPDAFDDPTIHVYTTAERGIAGGQDFFLLLMSYWEAVGLEIELHVVDQAIWSNYMFNFTRLQGGEENVGWIFCWNYQAFFNSMYHCANMYCSWGVHNCGNDPTVDELYLKAANEIDYELAAQYFADFQLHAASMYVNIGVARTDTVVVYNPETIGEFAGRNWVSFYDALNGIQHK